MKKLWLFLVVVAVASIPGFAQKTTGNRAPSGPHYDLNIIGVDQAKGAPLTGSNRHTIFVPLHTASSDNDLAPGTDIFLTQGSFAVCDGNAFDAAYNCAGQQIAGTGAVFQLPCDSLTATAAVPCTGNSVAAYTVWGRVVGKPGGTGTITTCALDSTNTEVCSTLNEVFVRNKSNKFDDVTKELTTIVTATQTFPLFNSAFQSYFWDYDNNGNKLVQLRFYLQ